VIYYTAKINATDQDIETSYKKTKLQLADLTEQYFNTDHPKRQVKKEHLDTFQVDESTGEKYSYVKPEDNFMKAYFRELSKEY
jgi:hypothetical protein